MEKYLMPHINAVPGDFGQPGLTPVDPLRSKLIAEKFLNFLTL